MKFFLILHAYFCDNVQYSNNNCKLIFMSKGLLMKEIHTTQQNEK